MRQLIIRPGGIGDTILCFPAMEHLRSRYTEVWVRSEAVPLVSFADRVRAIADTGLDLLGLPDIEPPAGLLAHLASFSRIDSWYGSGRPEFRNAVTGLPFRFHDALPPRGVAEWAGDFFARQTGAPLPAVPRIPVTPARHGSVVIHPLSGSPKKNWPLSRYVELSRRIPVEWAAREDWVRFAALDGLAGWLAGASVYVGNDSGITHLAAAVGATVVALFGATDPALWGPRGDRVHIVRGDSMEDISVDEVLHLIRSLLEPAGAEDQHAGDRRDQ